MIYYTKRTIFGSALKVSACVCAINMLACSYAVLYVREKPNITQGDSKSYENNPVIKSTKYVRGKEKVVYTRHLEISMSLCSFLGCNKKICAGFCAKPLETKPQCIAHVSQGTAGNAVPFHDKDLDNSNKPETVIVYKKPHETSSEINEEKTKVLHEGERLSKLAKIFKEKYDEV